MMQTTVRNRPLTNNFHFYTLNFCTVILWVDDRSLWLCDLERFYWSKSSPKIHILCKELVVTSVTSPNFGLWGYFWKVEILLFHFLFHKQSSFLPLEPTICISLRVVVRIFPKCPFPNFHLSHIHLPDFSRSSSKPWTIFHGSPSKSFLLVDWCTAKQERQEMYSKKNRML